MTRANAKMSRQTNRNAWIRWRISYARPFAIAARSNSATMVEAVERSTLLEVETTNW